MPFTSDAVCLADLASLLKIAAGASGLAPYWTPIVALQHQDAYDEIIDTLVSRGYDLPTILLWGRGAGVERKHTLYLVATQGAGLEGFDKTFIDKLDQTNYLKTCLLRDASGKQLLPIAGEVGEIGSGSEDTSRDLFRLDPDDERRGKPTRF